MSNVFDKSWEPAETVSDGGISIAHCLSLYFDGTSGAESNLKVIMNIKAKHLKRCQMFLTKAGKQQQSQNFYDRQYGLVGCWLKLMRKYLLKPKHPNIISNVFDKS